MYSYAGSCITTCSWGTSTMETWVHKFCCVSLVDVRGVLFSGLFSWQVVKPSGGAWWAGLGVRIVPSKRLACSHPLFPLWVLVMKSATFLQEKLLDMTYCPTTGLKAKCPTDHECQTPSTKQTLRVEFPDSSCVCVCFCVDILYCSPLIFLR